MLGKLDKGNQDSSVLMMVTMESGNRSRAVLGSIVSYDGVETVYKCAGQ